MLDWNQNDVQRITLIEDGQMFEEIGLSEGKTLHEGIGMRTIEQAQHDISLPSSRQISILGVWGEVEDRYGHLLVGIHLTIPHPLDRPLLSILGALGWGHASRCGFLKMQSCWCLPDTAQAALPSADHTLLGILRSIGHIIQDAEPLQRQWDLLRHQVSRDWNQSLPLTPFAGLGTNKSFH
jgi:hypothetical protein